MRTHHNRRFILFLFLFFILLPRAPCGLTTPAMRMRMRARARVPRARAAGARATVLGEGGRCGGVARRGAEGQGVLAMATLPQAARASPSVGEDGRGAAGPRSDSKASLRSRGSVGTMSRVRGGPPLRCAHARARARARARTARVPARASRSRSRAPRRGLGTGCSPPWCGWVATPALLRGRGSGHGEGGARARERARAFELKSASGLGRGAGDVATPKERTHPPALPLARSRPCAASRIGLRTVAGSGRVDGAPRLGARPPPPRPAWIGRARRRTCRRAPRSR